ncbi:MAG TPA: phosphoglucomutase [Ignavibacteriales bacterium]|nr:phosphoglucomutase [Ignavibacteriales bacterium]
MSLIFGTDGWRAIIDEDINETTVKQVAEAFAKYLLNEYKNNQDEIKVVVGYDSRLKSDIFAEIFASVLSTYNIKTFLSSRIVPTPFVSTAIKVLKLSAGVMITASHNPPTYNGVKFKNYYGGPFFTEETKKVENLISENITLNYKKNYEIIDLYPIYKEHILKILDFNIFSTKGLRVLVDSMNGAGQEYLMDLLKDTKIIVNTIASEPKNNFNNRLPEPIETNLQPLSSELKKGSYALGLATDGDADRLGVMLENGEWLSAQEQILYLVDYIINTKKITGNIVITSSVTGKIEEHFASKRIIRRVPVGFKYICEEFVNDNTAIGCEESGGYGFKIHIPERDGIFSGLLFIQMLLESGFEKLSDFVNYKRKEFGEIYYKRIDHHFNGNAIDNLARLISDEDSIINNKISQKQTFTNSRGVINGVKYIFDTPTQWVLIRCSETEPLVRIYTEGKNINEVEETLKYYLKYF